MTLNVKHAWGRHAQMMDETGASFHKGLSSYSSLFRLFCKWGTNIQQFWWWYLQSDGAGFGKIWKGSVDELLISFIFCLPVFFTSWSKYSPSPSTLSSLRAESARAVTGRRCPHSGVGEDFLACRPFLYENGRNSEMKSCTIDMKEPKWNQRRGLQTRSGVL